MNYEYFREKRYTWDIFFSTFSSLRKPTLTDIFNLEERYDSYMKNEQIMIYIDYEGIERTIEILNNKGGQFMNLQRCKLLYPLWKPNKPIRRFSLNIEYCNQNKRHVIIMNHYDNNFSALFDIETRGVFIKHNEKKRINSIGEFFSYDKFSEKSIQKYPKRDDFFGFHYIFLNTYFHDPKSEESFTTAILRRQQKIIPNNFINTFHFKNNDNINCNNCFCCKSYNTIFKLCEDINIKFNNFNSKDNYIKTEFNVYVYGYEDGSLDEEYQEELRILENLKNEYIHSYYYIHKYINEYINFVIQVYPDYLL